MQEYEIVIGLEVHAELNTKTKIFCRCPNSFGNEPNTNVCPVCMGFPGALPILNKRVVEYAVKAGLAMNCRINKISHHDRKNYFYPDLPKAYQISQSEIPVCENGYIDIIVNGAKKRIHINRIHIEEDAGKLIHDDEFDGTLIDFNRCGVPLIEIVSEPDMRSSDEARAYLETIKMTLMYLGISDCKMQEGSIRCDVNVSVRRTGDAEFGTRCEMKNVNSFSAAVRAIEYEATRQIKILEEGGNIYQETRRWDDVKGLSYVMRTKEDACDYRYFPEPDLLSIVIEEKDIQKIKSGIPELPDEKIWRYMTSFGLSQTEAQLIAEDTERALIFDESVKLKKCRPKNICNWLLSDIAKIQNKNGCKISEICVTSHSLCEIIERVEKGIISNTAGKKVLSIMCETGDSPDKIIRENKMEQNSDVRELALLVEEVISENQKSVNDYRNGKKNALGYIIGQCMKRSNGKANPAIVKEIAEKLLD
ncbi:MAG: Asp-tRNA(Asn)/Glu-tRNA(Gln) amidotransferase subunit GatB [Oscillospiraceae bacterium]|nr:Asp-tRNA(Asn)/Glu-tRNA(Gln) amidotransferase subunit GatB [Oscillospiraceae bacterium]